MHDTRELSSGQLVLLAERALSGDHAAETELCDCFAPRIYALICARTRDREVSRDLLHDALIALIRALRQGQLREPEKLAAFALGIARNTAQSYLRSGFRKREIPLTSDTVVSPEALLESEEKERHVAQAIGLLDATDREILRLTLVEGYKPGAISALLGMSSDVVRQRKTRATRKVADYVRNLTNQRSQISGDPPHGQ